MVSPNGSQVIAVGWEHEVPLSEVREARESLREALEAFYHLPVRDLTDRDVANYLVRVAGARYLRPGLWAW